MSVPHLDEDALVTLALPDKLRTELHDLALALCASVGDNLVSVSVYGSAARDEWDEASSDVNVLVVVEEVEFDQLARLGKAMGKARRKARVVPMLVTRDELREASDVFCIKFDDIRRHHVCIVGQDPLAELQIEESKLRFVCEFQLRNVAMRMRQFFLQSQTDREHEQRVLLRFFTSSLFSLRALARLRGIEPAAKVRQDFGTLQEALGADVSVLERLAEIHTSGEKVRADELTRLYARFNALVCGAVEVVDGLDADQSGAT